MPTQKPRFMVTVSDEMYDLINEYRFEKHFKSQTQAVNDLVERGLKALGLGDDAVIEEKKPAEVGELSYNEERFVFLYRQLGDEGRHLIEAYLSLSPSSRRLLSGFVELLLQNQEPPPVPHE